MVKKRQFTKQSKAAQPDRLLYGLHTVGIVLKHHPERMLNLFVRASKPGAEKNHRLVSLVNQARNLGIHCQSLTDEQIHKKVGHVNHQGVLAEYRPAEVMHESELAALLEASGSMRLLVLDCVTDPHNLGACIRSAEALGAQGLVLPKDKSASVNSTVRRVASGAAEMLPIFQVTNLARAIELMKSHGIWVLGASCDDTAQDIGAISFPARHAMVMGSEGAGLRSLTSKRCDALVKISMQGYLNSLNVSVATGIFLFASMMSAQSANHITSETK